MNSRPFAGVVFDCDGVLLETQPAWTAATQHLYRAHGLRLDDDEQRALLGASVGQIAGALARRLGWRDGQPKLERRLVRVLARRIGEARAAIGARRLVEHIWRDHATAVASNGPRAVVCPALARAGFAGRLDAIVTSDDVRSPKPAPDVYLEACARLDLPPASTVAIEDSPRGIEAARAAGLFVVALGSGWSANGGSAAHRSFERLDDPALMDLFSPADR